MAGTSVVERAAAPIGSAPQQTRRWWRRTPARSAFAVAAGALTGLAWQPTGWWPLLLIGVPALTLLIRDCPPKPGLGAKGAHNGVSRRSAFAIGYLFGLAMLGVSISWIHVLGIWVAVLLIAFEALFFGVLGLTLQLTSSLSWWPIAAALNWSLIEFLYARIPFGGFGWTRLAYAAIDTPLEGFFPLIGVTGVSFLVALIGQAIAYLVLVIGSRSTRRRSRPLILVGAAVLILLVAGAVWRLTPPAPAQAQPALQVGVVQGNVPGRGLEALGRMRSVTNNHLSETIDLMVKSRLGQTPAPDIILWPENSTDIDPTLDPITGQTVQAAASIAGRPILVGAVMSGPGPDERQTSALWWDPHRGILARYDKQDLVPFGEWIPFRNQLLPLIPILAEIGAQSVPGKQPGVLTVPVPAPDATGPTPNRSAVDPAAAGRVVKIGDIMCFELAYDDTVYSTVTNGAQVLLVQSNNATYGGTGQIEQQFAITRARAMETRREIAVATTNSVSGLIDAQGQVQTRTSEFTAASFVAAMPLRTAITPAVLIAPWLSLILAAGGLVACGIGLVAARRRAGQPEDWAADHD